MPRFGEVKMEELAPPRNEDKVQRQERAKGSQSLGRGGATRGGGPVGGARRRLGKGSSSRTGGKRALIWDRSGERERKQTGKQALGEKQGRGQERGGSGRGEGPRPGEGRARYRIP